ncbi:MAG: efflux RND transporter periplasmic adaptor subunit [Candidatus Omnitrophota bacterium]
MKKRIRFIVIPLILVIAAVAAAVFIFQEHNANGKTIKVSGNIEGDDVRMSFRVQGQIEELLTDEGRVVKKDDIVARLKKDELSKVQAEAEAALKLAEYQYKLDYDDYVRAENLLKAGAISAQKRDSAKTKMDTDSANIKQLRASLELANTKLGWADLASPLDGYILVKSSLAGEVVQPGTPVFTAVDLGNIWVTAYINETDLGKVKLGQKAHVQTDSYKGKKYDGWVSFISSQTEFTPKYIQTSEERVKYVYRIKVRVDNSSLDLKPGMPADAYIIIQ